MQVFEASAKIQIVEDRDKPRLYAHRGAAAELPENTMPSFERAVELGVDALETDVHMTRDGHIVVSHDDTGRRMANVDARIRDHDLEQVREWDMGWGFTNGAGERPFAQQGYHMPTFEELLVNFPDTFINVDVKQTWPPMVRQLIALIRRHDAEQRVLLASFATHTMARVRLMGYRGPTALTHFEVLPLVFAPERVFRALPLTGNAAQIPTHAGPIRLDTPAFIAKCHRAGVRVDYWTINEPTEARRLLQAGADGIMTDDPAAVLPAMGR